MSAQASLTDFVAETETTEQVEDSNTENATWRRGTESTTLGAPVSELIDNIEEYRSDAHEPREGLSLPQFHVGDRVELLDATWTVVDVDEEYGDRQHHSPVLSAYYYLESVDGDRAQLSEQPGDEIHVEQQAGNSILDASTVEIPVVECGQDGDEQ